MASRCGALLGSVLLLSVALLAAAADPIPDARAADKIRVGKSAPSAWAFTPVEVGTEAGIWAKYGLAPEVLSFDGDAKLQQGLASDSVDVGLGSGPSMGFVANGAPVMAVAAVADEPRNVSVVVAADSPLKSVDDLKGETLGVTTAGSLADWLAKRMAATEGWGLDGVKTVALGGMESSLAALKTHQVDGLVIATEFADMLVSKNEARKLIGMAAYAPHFHTQIIFARKELIQRHPEMVDLFLKGWFAAVAFMRANKERTVAMTARVLDQSPEVTSKIYDDEITMLSNDGSFDPEALATIKDSFLEMGILDQKPRDDQLLTRRFLPVKP